MAERSGRRKRLAALGIVLATVMLAAAPAPASAAPGATDAPEWWFDAWNVPALWASGADGRGVTVAIIDTGVQASIPELSGRVVAGADLIGNGTDGRVDFDSEDFSHGTAMASLVVARKGYGGIEGIAPGAKILPISVPLRGVIRNGTPARNATSAAVEYAADHGAKIISMSLGGFVYQGQDEQPCPPALQDAVIYALRKGAVVVAASGNSGEDGSPVEEPGVCLGVISVGAVDSAQNVTSFSSRHPYLSVAAPGDAIATLSKVPQRAFVGGGTSQATAITSGALALIWSKFPDATASQITSRLLGSAVDRGPRGRDQYYGLGVIDPRAAIAADAQAGKPNEVSTGVAPLLALAAAKPGKPPRKPAAGSEQAPLGAMRIGQQAPQLSRAFYLPLAGSGVALVLAVLLFVRASRRRRSSPRFAQK
jgi:subtilisin family serine protease